MLTFDTPPRTVQYSQALLSTLLTDLEGRRRTGQEDPSLEDSGLISSVSRQLSQQLKELSSGGLTLTLNKPAPA